MFKQKFWEFNFMYNCIKYIFAHAKKRLKKLTINKVIYACCIIDKNNQCNPAMSNGAVS